MVDPAKWHEEDGDYLCECNAASKPFNVNVIIRLNLWVKNINSVAPLDTVDNGKCTLIKSICYLTDSSKFPI